MTKINSFLDDLDKIKLDTKLPAVAAPKPKQIRRPRIDRTHNIKIPVDPVFKRKLRTMMKLFAPVYKERTGEILSQTKFNTLMLRYILKNRDMMFIDWHMEYIKTNEYMHTNLLETEYNDIGGPYGLANQMGFSERKTTYILLYSMVKWVEKNGQLNKIL